jgi:hypothetical protein
MDFLDSPTPFAEAVDHLLAKKQMPTDLSSAELRQLDAGIKRQSLFSARTTLQYHLDNIFTAVESVLNPKTEQRADRVTATNPQGNVTTGMNPATARSFLRQGLTGYLPKPGEEGTIKDLSSDARLNLVVKTNVQLAQGAGQFVQGNSSDDVVEAFPAWELIRFEDREVPRGEKVVKGEVVDDPGNDWPSRFRAAAEAAGDDDALRVLDETGRMMARKDSELWQSLGDGAGGYDDTLSNPYPPFAFNSGMWTQEVSREDAIDAGLIDAKDKVAPLDFDFSTLFAIKEAA